MTGLQSSLYTAAIALCVFSAGILRDRHGRSFAWFTGFLFVATLGFVFELLMVHPAMPLKSLWLGLRMGTSLLIAPCRRFTRGWVAAVFRFSVPFSTVSSETSAAFS